MTDFVPEGHAGLLYGDPRQRAAAIKAEPGLTGVLGCETEWTSRPEAMDYLLPSSPFHAIKRLSTRIYTGFIDRHLAGLPADALVLDAGCGIGRLTIALASRFDRVVAFDPCRSSLAACDRHLSECGADHVELHWADLSWLDEVAPGRFDAVVATELICYSANPDKALARLLRAVRPGGRAILSVEAAPGAWAAGRAKSPEELTLWIAGMPLYRPDDDFAMWFDRQAFEELLNRGGLADLEIEPSHYLVEGPFWNTIDDAQLTEPDYVQSVLRAEKACRKDPRIENWARVFCAAGTVPDTQP